MASASEYFDRDFSQNMGVKSSQIFANPITGESIEVITGLSFDFEAGAKFISIYVPDSSSTLHVIARCLNEVEDLTNIGANISASSGFAGTTENICTTDLLNTGRVRVYTARHFLEHEKNALFEVAEQKGLKLIIRDGDYLAQRNKHEKPLAFISHDSRDKEPFVRNLAVKLSIMACPVWYDEYSLIAGQSLRKNIENGLKQCKKCVLILSPFFLSNEGWTKAEFDSIFTREIFEKQDVIIPVWHGVSKEAIYAYSPRLLDKVGIPSTLETDEIAQRILRAINHDA